MAGGGAAAAAVGCGDASANYAGFLLSMAASIHVFVRGVSSDLVFFGCARCVVLLVRMC